MIDGFKFNDPELDSMGIFDHCLLKMLIERRITKEEYLAMEKVRDCVLDLREEVSELAFREFREVVGNM